MEIAFKNYKFKKENLNVTFKQNTIIGITGHNYYEFIDIFNIVNKYTNVYIDNNKLNNKNLSFYKNKISYHTNLNKMNINISIKDYLLSIIIMNDIKLRDNLKKIKDSLIISNLKELDLDTNINDLSTSEKTLLTLSINLLFNSDILILDDIYLGLDLKNIKKMNLLFNKLTDNYNKTIIIVSSDQNRLYKYTKYMYFIDDNKIVLDGNTKDVYKKINVLNKYNFKVPDSVIFINKVHKKKNIDLDYLQDIRDIMKDIYKHI
jgi:energy-coupling factor transporter ATP-binding protein EcfA2